MPQHPQYNEAKADFKQLNTMLYSMVQFGIMHEDGASDVQNALAELWWKPKREDKREIAEYHDCRQKDIEQWMVDDYFEDNRYEFQWDEVFASIPKEDKPQAVVDFRNAIAMMNGSSSYGCVTPKSIVEWRE